MLINMQQANNLRNHLLIAMPGLKDPLFEGAVVYICEHNEEGAMGLVINKEMPVELHDVCEQLEIPYELTTNSTIDRKSTRLNSSHVRISYAVFCLKKKKKT